MFPFPDEFDLDPDELAMHAGALAKVARAMLAKGKEAEAIAAQWAKYHDDPNGFFHDILSVTPWESEDPKKKSQADLIRAVGLHDRVACKSGHKIGKALHNDTPIPTPSGWKRHGDLRVGDQVFSDTGAVCNVVGTKRWNARPLIRLTFEDGSTVDADERHEWVVHSRESRKRTYKPPQTLETRQLAAAMTVPNGRDPDGTPRQIPNWTVDLHGGLLLPRADLPLDPYLLGVWLGDGSSSMASVTTSDPEIQQAFEAAGFDTERRGDKGRAWSFAITPRGRTTRNPFATILRELGVYGNKHIPEAYLWASTEQRLALLQGLLDTDGSISPKGRVQFVNTNHRLADGVHHLARSLGLKSRIREKRAMLNGNDCGPRWDVEWCSKAPVFRLQRKLDRVRTAHLQKASSHRRMAIVSAEPLPGLHDVQCIEVDSPSHLYLCGEAMVPTHNSITAVGLALWFVCTRKKARVLITAPTFHQVKNILWKELANLYRDRDLTTVLGVPLALDPATGLKLPNGNEIIGISTKTPENLAGISAPEMLFIVDEASGFPDELWTVLSKGNAAGGVKIFCISNPTRTSGWFFRLFRERTKFSQWELFTISSENTPNARTGQRVVPGVATRDFIEEVRRECGDDYENDPDYMVRIRGEFPPQGSDAVIGVQWVERATDRWKPNAEPELAELSLGVDVGRFGTDPSVVEPVRGSYAYPPREVSKADGPTVAALVIEYATELRISDEVVRVVVDGIGVGASVVDALKYSEPVQEGWMYIVDLNVGEAPDDEHHERLRDQLWFSCAAWLKDGAKLPNHEQLGGELLAATFSYTIRNKKKVMSKDKMRAILGKSPDYADALCLATYRGPRGAIITGEFYQGAPDLRHGDGDQQDAWED